MTCKDCNYHRTDGTCANKQSDYFGLAVEDGCVWREADWISIEDEMPKAGVHILLLCGTQFRIGYFDRHINRFISMNHNCTHVEIRDYRLEQTPDNWAEIRDDVTHWLPIPRLPESVLEKLQGE